MVQIQRQQLRREQDIFMKKKLLILTALSVILTFGLKSCAAETDNIALLAQKGFFEHSQQTPCTNASTEVRKTLYQHLKYANSYNYDALRSLYADSYTSADGLNKDIYFDLIKKTWVSYPDIKYKIDIKNKLHRAKHLLRIECSISKCMYTSKI